MGSGPAALAGPAGSNAATETPTKRRTGSSGKKDKEKMEKVAHSAGHSVASPSPPPSHAGGSPQPSTAGDRADSTGPPVAPGEDQRDYRVALFGK